MKRFLVLVFPLLFSMNVQGEIIGSFSDSVGIGNAYIHSDAELDITFYGGSDGTIRIGALFDALRVDETDTGSHFYANSSNDPYFLDAVGLLTNGEEDGIGADIGFYECSGVEVCGSAFISTEANAFSFEGNQIDFHGYTIDEIELVLDSVEFYRDTSLNRTEALVYLTVNVHGTVPPPPIDIAISVPDGIEQECISPNGTNVFITSIIDTADPALIDYISWTIDGEHYGYGASISPLLSMGVNKVAVTAALITTETATDTIDIEVSDTQPPSVFAGFFDVNTNQEITQASSRSKVFPVVNATDTCDPEPKVTAIVGVSADNGGVFTFDKSRKALSLKSTSDEEDAILSVVATDSSGNVAIERVELRILQ